MMGDGPGAHARFNCPGGLALDAQGRLLVCDQGSRRIRLVTSEGMTTTLGGADGPRFEGYRESEGRRRVCDDGSE